MNEPLSRGDRESRTVAYLDCNATTPVRPEVAAAMAQALAEGGNASSVHGVGRSARSRLERARRRLADALEAPDARIVFTSGATEANALALTGIPGTKLVSSVEHPSILENTVGAPRLPVDAQGVVRLDALDELLERHRPALVAVMAANNETGVLQPLAAIAQRVHSHGGLLHVDAVQALGRLPFSLAASGADLVAVSAHKLGGPPGVGALLMAGDVPLRAAWRGGGQEQGWRAGTENLPGIVGFAAALDLPTDWAAVAALRDHLEAGVRAISPDVLVAGSGAPRVANTSCLVTPGLRNEVQLMALDLEGVCVSTGAACSSGKVAASPVLTAMGFPDELAACAIRVSLGWQSGPADVERFLLAYERLVSRVRRGVE